MASKRILNKKEQGAENHRKGKKFEEEVEELLRLKGYTIEERNIKVGGYEIDIIATHKQGFLTTRVLVECKDKETVTVGDIGKFSGAFRDIKEDRKKGKKVDQALFISKQGFSPDAKGAARHIELMTYNDLLHHLIDFSEYIERYVSEYEDFDTYREKRTFMIDEMGRADMFRYYIPLNIKRQVPTPSSLRAFRLEYVENPRVAESLDQFALWWLKRPKERGLAVVGDYGTGKSSFALNLTYALAQEYQKDPLNNRVPIFISLKEFNEAPHIKDLLRAQLTGKYDIELNGSLLEKMLIMGRLVIILDGFDEMTNVSDERTIRENFKEISTLCVGESKVILTGRTHYFKKDTEITAVFHPEQEDLEQHYFPTEFFSVVEVDVLNDEQISAFITRHCDGDTQQAALYLQEIRTTYNLQDLAQRPLLLDMILFKLPDLLRSGERINHAGLYREYTDFWIKRDSWRSQIDEKGKKAFTEELAWQMFSSDTFTVHYTQISSSILQYFAKEIITDTDLDKYEYDTRTCSFLNRDNDGHYRFIHKSFMEFFVAKKLARDIQEGNTQHFAEHRLSPEINNFLLNILAGTFRENTDSYDEQIQTAQELFIPLLKNSSERNFQATNALHIVLQSDYIEATGRTLDCSGSYFQGLSVTGANLAGTNFRSGIFDKCTLWWSNCNNSDFSDAQALSLTITHTSLHNTQWHNVDFANIHARGYGRKGNITMSASGQYCLSSHGERILTLWDISDVQRPQIIWRTHLLTGTIFDISWSKDSSRIVVADSRMIFILDTDGNVITKIERGDSKTEFRVATLSHDNAVLYVGYGDGTLRSIDAIHGTTMKEFTRIVFGKFLRKDPVDGLFKEYDSKIHSAHEREIKHISLSSDGEYLLTVGDDKNARVWLTDGEIILNSMKIFSNRRVSSAAFLPDNRIIVLYDSGDASAIWSFDGSHEKFPQSMSSRGAFNINISRDGSSAVAYSPNAAYDKAYIWNLGAKEKSIALSPYPHEGWDTDYHFEKAEYTPDGKHIISIHPGCLRVWDADPRSTFYGQCIRAIVLGVECMNMDITHATGMDTLPDRKTEEHNVVDNDDVTLRLGTLREYLAQNGALAYSFERIATYLDYPITEVLPLTPFRQLRDLDEERLRGILLDITDPANQYSDHIRSNAFYVQVHVIIERINS